MTARVLLPFLEAFRIVGASPVFDRDLSQKILPGINFVLGGNGLGKTTTMQALTFGLTGGVSVRFEADRSFRWDHRWFIGRIGEEQGKGAFIEVEVSFGERHLGIRRNFSSSGVAAVKTSDSEEWVEDRKKAGQLFEEELARAGYRSVEDFAFLVHRLLYLSEDRRALAWDASAQARLLMLMSPEAIDEEAFRKSRDTLKKTDSKRRHTHVAVGKLEEQLPDSTEATSEQQPISVPRQITSDQLDAGNIEISTTDALASLERVTLERGGLEQQLRQLDADLEARSDEVDSLRRQIDAAEIALVQSTLHSVEKEQQLPLAKMLERGVCPACGTHQVSLQRIAREHAEHGHCVLCGSEEHTGDWESLAELQSQMSTKLRAQRAVDERRRALKGRLQVVQIEEERLSYWVVSQTTVASPPQLDLDPSAKGGRRVQVDVKQRLAAAQREEAKLLALVQAQQRRLSRTYEGFRRSVVDRQELLRELYERYATAFLGHKCILVEVPSNDRLFKLNQFVPSFKGVPRYQPESCSEAQQFFLDIALRMAFVSLGSKLSGTPGAFLCETPENALDISYLENVSKMFTDFASEKHSVVLTANIQDNSLYKRLLSKTKPSQVDRRVVNLLDYGQLSEVQKSALPSLRKHSPGSGGERDS